VNRRRIVVIGGGVIGLAAAWRLAEQPSTQVTLLDAAEAAREASWAAAGMLAPHHEAESQDDRWRLGCASLERWPAFAAELGGDLDLHLDGGLVPTLDPAEAAAEQARAARLGCGRWCDADELRRTCPALAPEVLGAVAYPGGRVDPRRLTAILAAACVARGVAVRYRTPATGLRPGAVLTQGGELPADLVVLASGAWTPDLARVTGIDLEGSPVKGQMLRLGAPDGLMDRFIHCQHAYVVPRAGSGIVVGSTMVSTGFDKAEDLAAITRLAAGARRLVPALAEAPIIESWTGLRPRLAGDLPRIDRVRDDLIIATGHFRNGILLTPITAETVACLASGGSVPAAVTPCLGSVLPPTVAQAWERV
jgi:glycine oxidase